MPEPSLLETLRQEHRRRECCGSPECKQVDRCYKCETPWPCPVARYIERAEALAKWLYDFHDNTWCACNTGDEVQCEMLAALAAYREE